MAVFPFSSPYNDLPGDPGNWTYDPPVLGASVGWQQPNYPEDVLLVQQVLNVVIDNGYLESQAVSRLVEDGSWDESLENALSDVEERYLSGMASPFGQRIVDNGSPLFEFLTQLAAGNSDLVTQYSNIMYQLAHSMLPGPIAARHLPLYLSNILQALAANGLADTTMILMALATIRAEAAAAAPVSEGVSKWNTSLPARQGRPGTHTFDLYDSRTDLGNTGVPDGARFRGRGFVQLTGRGNYSNYAHFFQWPLVSRPETANDAWGASMLLSKFLKNHETIIRAALRRGDLKAARRAVNGGSHGLLEFTTAYRTGRAFLQNHIAGDIITRIAANAALEGN